MNRQLTPSQKSRAAECLGMSYSHFNSAQILIRGKGYAAAVAQLYFSAFFAAQAACVEHGGRSKKHSYWVGLFNKKFGEGRGWIPRLYPKLLNKLYEEREATDYAGTLSNDEDTATRYELGVKNLVKKVRDNTPLLLYPDFIIDFLEKNIGVLAVEFDYYCPKAYIHKERVQLQVQAKKYNPKYINKIIRSGELAIATVDASRKNDYVLGWNNRLGQSGDGYLLFLDIDESDEGKVRSALKDRKGWLFKSGEGFHFIGKEVLSSERLWLHRFKQAAKSRKLKNLVDEKHIDFSIRRGYSTLRVTRSEVKDFVPFMCWDNTQ